MSGVKGFPETACSDCIVDGDSGSDGDSDSGDWPDSMDGMGWDGTGQLSRQKEVWIAIKILTLCATGL
jgi:hypothetical protein